MSNSQCICDPPITMYSSSDMSTAGNVRLSAQPANIDLDGQRKACLQLQLSHDLFQPNQVPLYRTSHQALSGMSHRAPEFEHLPPPPPAGNQPYQAKCDPSYQFTEVLNVRKPLTTDDRGETLPGAGYFVLLQWRAVGGYPFEIWQSDDDTSVLWNARFCKMRAMYHPASGITTYEPDPYWREERREMQELRRSRRRRERDARAAAEELHGIRHGGHDDARSQGTSRSGTTRNATRHSRTSGGRSTGRSTAGSGPFQPPPRYR